MLVQAGHVLLFRCDSEEARPLRQLPQRVHTARVRRKIAVEPGELAVADRAYFTPRGIQHVLDARADALVRYRLDGVARFWYSRADARSREATTVGAWSDASPPKTGGRRFWRE